MKRRKVSVTRQQPIQLRLFTRVLIAWAHLFWTETDQRSKQVGVQGKGLSQSRTVGLRKKDDLKLLDNRRHKVRNAQQ